MGEGRQGPAEGDRSGAAVSGDHFSVREGAQFAGTHVIIDLFSAARLDDRDHIAETLRRCIDAAGATLLHIHLHAFESGGGLSGIALLAESHISVHTWPERGFAAFDIFMCGRCDPHECIPVLRDAFHPKEISVTELLRGRSDRGIMTSEAL